MENMKFTWDKLGWTIQTFLISLGYFYKYKRNFFPSYRGNYLKNVQNADVRNIIINQASNNCL